MPVEVVEKRYFNAREASTYTGIPRSTLYDMAKNGEIPSIRMGSRTKSRIKFDREDIDRFLQSRKSVSGKVDIEKITSKIVSDVLQS